MSQEHDPTTSRPAGEVPVGHEPNTFDVRTAVISLAGVAVLSLMTFAIMIPLYRGLAHPVEQRDAAESGSTALQASREQVEPKLSRGGPDQLNALREAAHETLHSYAWVDQPAGIARVPISRAIEMVVEEGLPTKETNKQVDEAKPSPTP